MKVQHYLQRLLPSQDIAGATLTPIAGDASNRQYYRVTDKTGRSRVLCIDPAFAGKSPETYPFIAVRQLLSDNGIAVPELYSCDPQEGVMLLEDCGSLMLQDEASRHPGNIGRFYTEVIDTLVLIQSIQGPESLSPFRQCFDRQKLMEEFMFFIDHALRYGQAGGPDDSVCSILTEELEKIARILDQPGHFLLNHRDFHSRNILLHAGRPYIIDFQDARMGLPQYDAVSLLRDSYLALPAPLRSSLETYHFSKLVERNLISMSLDEYIYLFDVMAFQRSVKALGTFFYQARILNKQSFTTSIPPTLAYIEEYIDRQPVLKKAGTMILSIINSQSP
ncbi:aminoglycoside phosphotransferase family protein [Prosthecochloris sp. HL-130-GSB]|jgi:N-acetylmuramate 1-kinase|uniref:aminoglycoside phosphotransferase family protein n=1 Tax=Prosthecochloris sp. HL-130-GSB TaxID=1974213 RepID=UPI000A1C189E|nr:phosphotransferase [Prosthecochloris sp. HL-130-GSB]ARM30171.1 hypothetical protein B9H02_01055 [Prosthecochloris sp. HL-130-GSB]